MSELVAMTIKGLMLDPVSNSPIVVLKDDDEKFFLPIWVGIFEANAIALQLENITTPRPMTHDLLRTMIENGRLAALPEVAAQFHALVNQRAGVSDAVIHSAFPIEAAQLGDVVAALEKRFARKLNPSVVVEPELIGGIRVVVGDEVLDTSVKARLQQMKVALTA